MKKIVLNIALLVSAITFTSCDKDFNTIGSDVIGDDHFDFEKKDDVSLIAYTRATGPVQTNNLPLKALGVYKDDYFGTTKASFVTQVSLSTSAPDFGIEIAIQATDSVYLYIPYVATQTAAGTGNEANTYKLSEYEFYGDNTKSISLKVFESNFLLRDFEASDPSIRKKYYSDEKSLIENTINTNTPLNDVLVPAESTEFKFSNEEIRIFKTNATGQFLDANGAVTTDATKKVIKERIAPGMWLNLNKEFFENKVLKASDANLLNNNVFREHLKGLYFQVDANADSEALALLDFSSAYINIQYHSKKALTTDALEKKSFRLQLAGNSITFLENNNSTEYTTALNSSNSLSGDALLYPKGGDGSVVFIDLFGPDDSGDLDNIPEELEQLRADNILVNDAFLTFYVKKDLPLEASKNFSNRVYLYDATNNTPLLDYVFDSSTAADSKNNKLVFGGILEIDEDDEGIRYKVRLRNHINNIINGTNASTNGNVRLGLSVTQNINNAGRYEVKNITSFGNQYLPIGSIIQPKGAVIFGNNVNNPLDADKKLKLEIYYTKPN